MIRNTAASIVLAASVTVAALTPATEVRAATKFDGSWSVVVFTRNGPCDAAYRLSGQIINGAIVYNGIGSVAIAGRVRPNGAASLRVSSGGSYAVASGHMTRDAWQRELVWQDLRRPLQRKLDRRAVVTRAAAIAPRSSYFTTRRDQSRALGLVSRCER